MTTMSMAPAISPQRDETGADPRTRPAGHPRGAVRLTRRGRLVVFAGALLAVLTGGIVWGAGSVATHEAGTPEPTQVVMVEPGDTLWGLAAEVSEDGDVRETMHEIERLNALDSVSLSAGQRLRVPVPQ